MSILTANLKFFYQRPAVWYWYFFMGLLSFPLAFSLKPGQPGFWFHVFFIPMYSGLICGSLLKDALGKPFSFCLPKSRQAPGKIILIVGTVINLLVSLLYIHGHPSETFFSTFQIGISVFFAGMSFFLITAVLGFQANPNGPASIIFVIFFIFLFSPFGSRKIEANLFSHPFIITLFGISLGLFTWFRIGQREVRRRLCLTPSLSMFDGWNHVKTKRVKEQLAAQKMRSGDERWRNRLENFFLAGMKHYNVLSVGRNVWGNLYRFLGNPGHRPGQIILLAVAIVVFFAFCTPKHMQGFIFVIPMVMAGVGFPLPLKHSMLLPAGRKEQIGTAMVLMPGYTVLVIAALVVAGIFWQGLYTLVPQVTVTGQTFTCNPFEWTYLYTPFVFLPMCFILRRYITRYVIFIRMILMMVAVPAGFLLFPWLTQKGPLIIIPLAGVLWAVCFLAYRDYFRRANLVGQGKG